MALVRVISTRGPGHCQSGQAYDLPFAQTVHQALGLISPSTSLQAFGAWKWRQPAQLIADALFGCLGQCLACGRGQHGYAQRHASNDAKRAAAGPGMVS
jgi:hypothetical protein